MKFCLPKKKITTYLQIKKKKKNLPLRAKERLLYIDSMSKFGLSQNRTFKGGKKFKLRIVESGEGKPFD